MRHSFALSALGLALSAAVPVANAATTTSAFQVTATVNANCSVSAGTLAFGAYIPGAGDVANTSTISVNCTKGTTFNVGLDAGLNASGVIANRAMKSGANPLAYQLYSDTSHTIVWGNTVGTDTVAGTGLGMGDGSSGQVVSLPVYGQITDTANLAAAAGSYSDTVTVTVTY